MTQKQSNEVSQDLMCDESKQILSDENVVLKFKRSKNENVVIYRACLDKNGKLNNDKPLEIFWLKIEPSYIKKRRNQGHKNDRTELTYIESTLLFTVSYFCLSKNKPFFNLSKTSFSDLLNKILS